MRGGAQVYDRGGPKSQIQEYARVGAREVQTLAFHLKTYFGGLPIAFHLTGGEASDSAPLTNVPSGQCRSAHAFAMSCSFQRVASAPSAGL